MVPSNQIQHLGHTWCSLIKDVVYRSKQDGVAYKTPYKCGKVYIGETERAMQEKMKEHKRDDMTNTQPNLLFQRIKKKKPATICLGTR